MRSREDAIKLIKIMIEEAKAEKAKSLISEYDEGFLDGRISGLESTLYFLGDPEAIIKHDEFVRRIMEKHKGESA